MVEHVVDLVGQTCLTDNEIFLRLMAKVETQDGTDGQTYRNDYNGGIWNVSYFQSYHFITYIAMSKLQE